MYNSIQQFMELGIVDIEKIINNFVEDSKISIGDLVTRLNKPLQKLVCDIVSETLEQMDTLYRESEDRKSKYVIERSRV